MPGPPADRSACGSPARTQGLLLSLSSSGWITEEHAMAAPPSGPRATRGVGGSSTAAWTGLTALQPALEAADVPGLYALGEDAIAEQDGREPKEIGPGQPNEATCPCDRRERQPDSKRH